MKAESEPIADDEWLLRRVPLQYWDSPRAFEPRLLGKNVRDPDLSGISLYRESCLTHPEDILAPVPPEKWGNNGIVRIPMALVIELGLSAQLEPDARVKGHVVIPELRAEIHAANKSHLGPLLVILAATARENVVRRPNSIGTVD